MYLKFETRSEFPALAEALCADLTEDMIDWDSENVYEWMYVDLPQLAFSLNISREHGWANVDNDTMDQYRDNEDKLKEHVHPGAVYVFGWDRKVSDYVDQLPDFLPAFIANQLSVRVDVYDRRINVDVPDGRPCRTVHPQHEAG